MERTKKHLYVPLFCLSTLFSFSRQSYWLVLIGPRGVSRLFWFGEKLLLVPHFGPSVGGCGGGICIFSDDARPDQTDCWRRMILH